MKRRMLYFTVGFVVTYMLVLFAGCHLQERFIFFPEKLPNDHAFGIAAPDSEITLQTADGASIDALHYKRPGNKLLAIYFHGNAGSLESWKRVSAELLPLDMDVLVIDYRSYGKSTGRMSEKGLYNDGEAAFSYALKAGYSTSQIIFFGRSLGTGIATEMAIRHPDVKALILETPYTSIDNRAQEMYPALLPKLYLKYKLDNFKKAPKLVTPVLVLHGTADDVIPYHHGKKVFDAIGCKKEMITFEGGKHNNLSTFPEHAAGIKKFLEGL